MTRAFSKAWGAGMGVALGQDQIATVQEPLQC